MYMAVVLLAQQRRKMRKLSLRIMHSLEQIKSQVDADKHFPIAAIKIGMIGNIDTIIFLKIFPIIHSKNRA